MRAQIYDIVVERANPFYKEMLEAGVAEAEAFVEWSKIRRPLRILEVGIGTGNQMSRMTDRKLSGKLTAIDSDPEMLEGARSKLAHRLDCVFKTCKAEEYDWTLEPNAYDVCLSNLVLHYFASIDRSRLLRSICESLSSPGLFVYGDRVVGAAPFFDWRYEGRVKEAKNSIEEWRDAAAKSGIRHDDLEYFAYDEREMPVTADQVRAEAVSAGFDAVDVVWRRLNYMVVVAVRA